MESHQLFSNGSIFEKDHHTRVLGVSLPVRFTSFVREVHPMCGNFLWNTSFLFLSYIVSSPHLTDSVYKVEILSNPEIPFEENIDSYCFLWRSMLRFCFPKIYP